MDSATKPATECSDVAVRRSTRKRKIRSWSPPVEWSASGSVGKKKRPGRPRKKAAPVSKLNKKNGAVIPFSSGSQPAFSKSEKVLCYEPDMTKAKVLHDSKVLEVLKRTRKGEVYYEYKIHFHTLNRIWDRCVKESFVLKNTAANKKIQRALRDAAEQKNKNETALEDQVLAVTKKIRKTAIKDDSEAEDETENANDPPKMSSSIILPNEIRQIMEYDFFKIKLQKWWVRIPARVTVIELLEDYVRHVGKIQCHAFVRFTENVQEKVSSGRLRNKNPVEAVNQELERTKNRINFTQQVAEELRKMFDAMLPKILLYKEEEEQYRAYLKGVLGVPRPAGQSRVRVVSPPKDIKPSSTKVCCSLEEKCPFPFACQHLSKFMDDLERYEMIPRKDQIQLNCSPAASFGLYHFLRLCVKAPEVFCRMTIPRREMGRIVGEINNMLLYFVEMRDYIMQSSDWFQP